MVWLYERNKPTKYIEDSRLGLGGVLRSGTCQGLAWIDDARSEFMLESFSLTAQWPLKIVVTVAQLVESRIVIPVVVGSSPIGHPKNSL